MFNERRGERRRERCTFMLLHNKSAARIYYRLCSCQQEEPSSVCEGVTSEGLLFIFGLVLQILLDAAPLLVSEDVSMTNVCLRQSSTSSWRNGRRRRTTAITRRAAVCRPDLRRSPPSSRTRHMTNSLLFERETETKGKPTDFKTSVHTSWSSVHSFCTSLSLCT